MEMRIKIQLKNLSNLPIPPMILFFLQFLWFPNIIGQLMLPPAQQQGMQLDWNNINTVFQSVGPWQFQVPERFIRDRMMPFIQQFRRQLNPMSEITWFDSGSNRIQKRYIVYSKFTHIDLDPPEQKKYRPNGPASTRDDLAGMIVREMWRKAKKHCLQCSINGGRQCELVAPDCGFPYQLFDDQAQQIHCTLTLQKQAGMTKLRGQMQCQTLPATPLLPGSILASNYQANWRLMCVNCVPQVYQGIGGGSCPMGQLCDQRGNVGGGNNNSNAYGRINLMNNNDNGWSEQYYTGSGQRNVLRVWTNRKYSRIYQINNAEGRDIARFINRIRAEIARGEAPNLPVAAGMNQIKWKSSLASEAQKQLMTRDNDPVNIVDLEVTFLIPNATAGRRRQRGGVVTRGRNYVDLDSHSLLLWTARNYLEMFTNQQGLHCSSQGNCKATCRKGSQRTRVVPWQRMAENPADFHCYPYELLYDRAHSIGCAVRFVTKQRTHLQAKMVCVIEHQYGRNGSVRRMMHRHNVYKIGTACSRCENSHYCDNRTKLCVSRNAQQHGYEPIGQLKLSSDSFDNIGNNSNNITNGRSQRFNGNGNAWQQRYGRNGRYDGQNGGGAQRIVAYNDGGNDMMMPAGNDYNNNYNYGGGGFNNNANYGFGMEGAAAGGGGYGGNAGAPGAGRFGGGGGGGGGGGADGFGGGYGGAPIGYSGGDFNGGGGGGGGWGGGGGGGGGGGWNGMNGYPNAPIVV